MNFKVGDIIKGKKENGDCFINECMLKAEVVTADNVIMSIKILEHTDPKYVNKTWSTWNEKNFFDYVREEDTLEHLTGKNMTFNDAANWFKEELKGGKCSETCVQCSANEIALQAIEKQIPKKPLSEKRYYGNGKCPSCNAVFLDKSTPFCGNCGQAINWNENEE